MDVLPGTSKPCLTCGRPRLRQEGACAHCGSETKTIEIDDGDDSATNREHWGFE